jgi:hypothetical protein
MAHSVDVKELQEELIDAFKFGEEDRARVLVSQLGEGPAQVRAVLEMMLENTRGLVRQAAVFGLGELGGPASAERLEQQLVREEKRGDYDGQAVVEDIIRALGRIHEPGARASLLWTLEQMGEGKLEHLNPYVLARSLWRIKHPDILPALRRCMERLPSSAQPALRGLSVLLEKTPEQLRAWVRDLAIPLEHKTEVLVVVEEQVPDELIALLPDFIAMAQSLEERLRPVAEVEAYCERLFGLLLSSRERLLTGLPAETLATLRTVTRSLIVATAPNASTVAAVMLGAVGHFEDAAFLDAHRPAYPALAKVFDDAARALRG